LTGTIAATPAPQIHSTVQAARSQPQVQLPDYVNARERANSLVAQLTLDEKLSLVISYFPYISAQAEALDMPMCSGFTPGIPRLGIPALRISDASLGVANVLNRRCDDEATALPSSLATGASFDLDLAFAGGSMIAAEARAKTFNVLLGGGINLTRDPWAGRNFEYLGEDALHTGLLGAAGVCGVQSRNVACTVKHYVLNPQETGRMIVDGRIDEAALRESDLLAFEIAIERSAPASVMAAYSRINSEYASENARLIDILKGEWSYAGWLMSDWGSVHSTEKAALAGLDQESGIELDERLNGEIFFTGKLREAVDAGRVPVSRIDEMVARILAGTIASGAFDEPVPNAPQPIDYAANAEVAQRVAEAGCVLLHNEGLLPLSRTLTRIAVIGGHADVGVPSGGGSSQVRSVGGAPIERSLESGDSSWFCRETYHASSPLDAIRALNPQAQVSFDSGEDRERAAIAAAQADVVIVFANQWRTEATDLLTLALPDGQDELIAAVAAANPHTVVVVQSGGAVLMPWLSTVPAVLAAWYPGQGGGQAIARILFGDVNPSGRLPLTFPANDDQAPRPVPPGTEEMRARDAAKEAGDATAQIAPFEAEYNERANVGYRWFEVSGQVPLFPFGFGLAYSRFEYRDFEVVYGARPRIRVVVANAGQLAGADVPQVYVRAADDAGIATWRLAAFTRLELAPGESRQVELELEPRSFARWDAAAGGWHVAPVPHQIAVARSATDRVLTGTLDGALVKP